MNSDHLLHLIKSQNVQRAKRVAVSEGFDIFRERGSSFSLRSRTIRPSDFFGPRRKVAPRREDYAWALVSGVFDKLHEVGFYPTCFTLCLSVL